MANLPIRARTEFTSALSQICAERGIDEGVVLETIKEAILAAYRKEAHGLEEDMEYEVEVDPETGAARLFAFLEGKKKKKKDVTPPGFGRIATQTAKQVILQKIREAEKEAIIKEYCKRVETLVNGMILRFEGKNIICDIGRGQGVMPPEEQVRVEPYHLNQRLAFYILDIREMPRGKAIIVSRASEKLVAELFRREVPEVSSKAVEIRRIARESGFRSKVAVFSNQKGVDPVGSCVGRKGIRVQAVIKELNGEKIDIIQYSEDPEKFISAALQPAENLEIKINKKKKKAQVIVPEDQLSLAIGKDGQNVRLAAKLTGFKIDIRGPKGVKEPKEAKKIPKEYEIDGLGLSTRTRNLLIEAKIQKIKDLKAKKEEELLAIKGLGEKAVREIKTKLKKSEKK